MRRLAFLTMKPRRDAGRERVTPMVKTFAIAAVAAALALGGCGRRGQLEPPSAADPAAAPAAADPAVANQGAPADDSTFILDPLI